MGAMPYGPRAPERGPEPGFRAVRAAVFTAVCVTLSAGTHVVLSAGPVPLPTLLAVAAVVFVAAYALAGRERGFGAIAALLLPLQLGADTLFTTGQQACYGTAGGPVTGPLRSMGFDLICTGGEFGTPLARLAGDNAAAATTSLAHPAAPWLLLGGHLAVGLAAAAWLWRGDAALSRLLRAAAAEAVALVRPLLAAVLLPVAETDRPGAARTAHRPRPTALPLLVHSVVRRGPPRQAALFS